ncbi:MAG TPA: sigma-54 dependent transcriptional regulator [Cellvibrionaceae bacterium]
MTTKHALVIDDEPDIRELLEITLGRMNIDTTSVASVSQAKMALQQHTFSLCLTDMRLPDGNGLEVVEYIQQHHPRLPVAVITAHGNVDVAIESMKAGAFDFISKPVDLATLRKLVNTAIQSETLPSSVALGTTSLIGESIAIKQLSQSIQKLSRSQAPVYISGESGSGKELVARSIHQLGPRREHKFVAVNCGAIPRELIESELFGHVKGSFTGAHQDNPGLFKTAEGGTLFFDEVADLPLDMQVKLLRAIQEKSVRPVGGATEIATDVRILCATHKNLEQEVANGFFRQDLFYRLNVIQLAVPPLRQRAEDIPLLADHFLQKIAKEAGIDTPILTREALAKLVQYSFPGNVRELENILERALTLTESQLIDVIDLQLPTNNHAVMHINDSHHDKSEARADDHFHQCLALGSLDTYLEEIEKDVLCTTLENSRWNKTQAAKKLGISFRSLRYRLKKLGLDSED